MKVVLAFLALVAVVAAETCTGNNVSTCTMTCGSGLIVACEHSLCTCAATCHQASDCTTTCANGGARHCIDGACICDPNGGNHHNNNNNNPGNHNPGHHGG